MQSTSKVAVEEQFANGKLKELNNIEVTRFENYVYLGLKHM